MDTNVVRHTLNRRLLPALLLATTVLAGCGTPDTARTADDARPTDSPAPPGVISDEHGKEEITDVGRDLMNVVRKVPNAPAEFSEDFKAFITVPQVEPQVVELARRLVTALQNASRMTLPDAQKLSEALFRGISTVGMSAEESKRLREQIKASLIASGTAEADGESVSKQLDEVQKVVGRLPKAGAKP